MEIKDIRLTYQEAIQLMRVGHYESAHRLLTAIDKERPHVKNVLYPLAACCEALGFVDEGLDYCDRLIRDYNHDKARQIRERLLAELPVPEEVELPTKEKEVQETVPVAEAVDDSSPFPDIEASEDKLSPEPREDSTPPPAAMESSSEDLAGSERAEVDPLAETDDTLTADSSDADDDQEAQEASAEDAEEDADTSDRAAMQEEAQKAHDALLAELDKDDDIIKTPLWIVLLLAFVAAAVTAALIHYFILDTKVPLEFLMDLYTKLLATIESLRS